MTLTDKYGQTYDVLVPAGGERVSAHCKRHFDGKVLELYWNDLRAPGGQATAFYGLVGTNRRTSRGREWTRAMSQRLREMRRELYERTVREYRADVT